MNKEQIDLLGEYIKVGNSIVLIEEVPESVIQKGAVVLDASCSSKELMGGFEDLEYKLPDWYVRLNESAKEHTPVLVIKDINKIPEKEQRKFIELFKYKKVYTNKLPENTMIFVTYQKDKPIDEELYSFMVQI